MSNIDNGSKNNNFLTMISSSDTISQFMEKCNNNFAAIINNGGGPAGTKGDGGDPGVPTKPKVPIHVWKEGEEYAAESSSPIEEFEIKTWNVDLSNSKYQEGHLILLENAHVYILKLDNNFNLIPKFIIALQSYNPGDIINGKNSYVHFAYVDNTIDYHGFITDQQLNGNTVIEKPYIGTYSDNYETSSTNPSKYTWVKIQGNTGLMGEKGDKGDKGDKGEKGDKGDGYTGNLYTVDLEGDISTISLDINRNRLYDEICKCRIHAYYGNENVKLSSGEVSVILPKGYKYLNNNGVDIVSNENNHVGKIEKEQSGNDVVINFIPDESFEFPLETMFFSIHIETSLHDESNKTTYEFVRDTVWMVKGIISTFKLEIVPQHRIIKLDKDGTYYPKNLLVSVYKVENGERSLFDIENNKDFYLKYKNFDNTNWENYPSEGVKTEKVSCLEFKLVKKDENSNNEEIWDYEDVWVVSDGKDSHYYHADLGNTESMMVLTTGEKVIIDGTKECAKLRNESGYSITFNPKIYDGTEELTVTEVNIGTNSGEEYYQNGTFKRELKGSEIDGNKSYTLKITSVPFNVDIIPMNIVVVGEDKNGVTKSDSISFNVYISTITNIYTLSTISSFNTSTGKDGDVVDCKVYKNNVLVPIDELEQNSLKLEYIVHNNETDTKKPIKYEEPLVYGDDSDLDENEFTASDVAISFILSYRNEEVAKSTVPLIKDGIDGKDGDSWQYIFCRSSKYPFEETGISDPSLWTDNAPNDSDNELLGNNGEGDVDWSDNHQGVNNEFKYEYQSYRKWDKNKNCWGKYEYPTLYSNFSKNGSGYSVMLSNPVAAISVDENFNVSDEKQSDSTFVYLYENSSDISSRNGITLSLPEDNEYVKNGHFKKENNKIIFNPIVNGNIFNFTSNVQYKLPIKVTYKPDDSDDEGDFITTINWTLNPIKGFQDVEVFVDKKVVNISNGNKHSLKVGYYIKNSNGGKKFIGNFNDGTNLGYKIKITDDITNLPSTTIRNWQNVEYNFVENGENRSCYVVLVDSDKETIIDYTNVVPVNDGLSSIQLELTQYHILLPAGTDGSVHPDYKHPIHSQMMLYSGGTLIDDYDNIVYSFNIDGEQVYGFTLTNDGGFDIPKEVINGDTNIECIATYNNTSYHKNLFIDLEDVPYELGISTNVLNRDVNTKQIENKNIIVRVQNWINGKWNHITYGVVKANTTNGKENLDFELNENGDFVLKIEDSILKTNSVDTEVRISYFIDSDSEEICYETIGIINSGKNGTVPSTVKTEILGYSLDAGATINDSVGDGNDENGTPFVWQKYLNSLNAGSGVPIYILNESTLDNGNTSRTITVTLSGTQGVDGKSRVLFYLGSFKDKTLTGNTIEGILDDDRCDYYIDIKGNAWMRTGPEGKAVANPTGGSAPYWKQATEVGFIKAGAIHADMINTNSITANSALVNTLFAQDVTAENLKVNAANIIGKLTIGSGDNSQIEESAIKTVIGNTEIDGGKITTNSITADKIAIHSITAEQIDVNQLEVIKLNTKPNDDIDKIQISENYLNVYSNYNDDILVSISSNEITPSNLENINNEYTFQTASGQLYTYEEITEPNDDFKYVNNFECKIQNNEIGVLEINSEIKIGFRLKCSNYTNQGGTGDDAYLKNSQIKITENTFKIIIERYNNISKKWEECGLSYYANDNFEDSAGNPITSFPSTDKNSKDIFYNYNLDGGKYVKINKKGLYRYSVIVNTGSFYTNINTMSTIFLNSSCEIIRSENDARYVEIGKNGAIFKNSLNSTFLISENEIGFRVGDYGIKVTSDGIFIKTPSSNKWVQKDFSKLIDI